MTRFLTGLSLRQWLLAGILIVLALATAVQTVRLEGFRLWPFAAEAARAWAVAIEAESRSPGQP